jgi:CDP-diglyceride synthetase
MGRSRAAHLSAALPFRRAVDVWVGGIWFNLFVALLAVLIAHEWTNMVHGRSSAQFALHAAAALSGARCCWKRASGAP